MPHRLSFVIGLLELASAAMLALISWSLPSRPDVQRTFGSAREMAQVSRQHLQTLENQMSTVHQGAAVIHGGIHQFANAMTTLEQVRYPVVTLNGITPSVAWQSFLPRGAGRQAREIDKASQAGVSEIDQLKLDLPRIRSSLEDMEHALDRYSRRSAAALWYGRLLMGLVALSISLHGGHLLFPVLLPIFWPSKMIPEPLSETL